MVFIAFEVFGEAGDIGLGDDAGIFHHADDTCHELTVEGGALLLAGVIDLGCHFGDGEDVAPELFITDDILFLDMT